MSAWTVTHEDDVAVLSLNLQGEPVNKLTPEVVADFERLFFGEPRRGSAGGAVVITSDKPDNFLAGADIDGFSRSRRPKRPPRWTGRART
jgi:enoyl-CoA hydratase/carnithine racemase